MKMPEPKTLREKLDDALILIGVGLLCFVIFALVNLGYMLFHDGGAFL